MPPHYCHIVARIVFETIGKYSGIPLHTESKAGDRYKTET